MNLLKNKLFYFSLIILLFGMAMNPIMSNYLKNKYTSLPILNDIFLDNLPYIKVHWLYHLFAVISVGLFIYYAVRYKRDNIPYYMLLFGIFQIVRAVFIVLTPMAIPYNYFGSPYSFIPAGLGVGAYPSGHVGTAFLAFLLSHKFKYTFLVLIILLITTLFLGRGHYSIDVFSGIIFAYAIYCFGDRHIIGTFIKK